MAHSCGSSGMAFPARTVQPSARKPFGSYGGLYFALSKVQEEKKHKNINEVGSEGGAAKMSALCLTHGRQQQVKRIYLPLINQSLLFSFFPKDRGSKLVQNGLWSGSAADLGSYLGAATIWPQPWTSNLTFLNSVSLPVSTRDWSRWMVKVSFRSESWHLKSFYCGVHTTDNSFQK